MKKLILMKNKKDITKTEILEAAEKVFQKWGLNKITMEDIAEASGRCKGSLYYYYKDKEEIMKILVSGYIKEIIEKSENEMNKQSANNDKLKAYFITINSELKKYVNLYDIFRGEIKGYPKLIDDSKQKFSAATAKLIKEVLINGMSTGEFRSFDKSTIDIICYSIISFMSNLGMELTVENKKFNIKQRIDVFIEILFNGLRS